MIADTLTKSGAELLAGRIRGFWRKHGGAEIEVSILRQTSDRADDMYVVRSNLVRGLPSRLPQSVVGGG